MQPFLVAAKAAAHPLDERIQRRLQPRRQGPRDEPEHPGRSQIAGRSASSAASTVVILVGSKRPSRASASRRQHRVRQRAGGQVDAQPQHEVALVVRDGGGAEIQHQIARPGRRHARAAGRSRCRARVRARAPAPDRRACGRGADSTRRVQRPCGPSSLAKRSSQSPSMPTRWAAGGSVAPKPQPGQLANPQRLLHRAGRKHFQALGLDRLDQRALVAQQGCDEALHPARACPCVGAFRQHRVRSRTAPRRAA